MWVFRTTLIKILEWLPGKYFLLANVKQYFLANVSRLTSRKADDDVISECTMDILTEATINTQAFGAYDVNDDVTSDARKESAGYSGHIRRSSVGSSSMQSESTQGMVSSQCRLPVDLSALRYVLTFYSCSQFYVT